MQGVTGFGASKSFSWASNFQLRRLLTQLVLNGRVVQEYIASYYNVSTRLQPAATSQEESKIMLCVDSQQRSDLGCFNTVWNL